jgi:hypothetical protein
VQLQLSRFTPKSTQQKLHASTTVLISITTSKSLQNLIKTSNLNQADKSIQNQFQTPIQFKSKHQFNITSNLMNQIKISSNLTNQMKTVD